MLGRANGMKPLLSKAWLTTMTDESRPIVLGVGSIKVMSAYPLNVPAAIAVKSIVGGAVKSGGVPVNRLAALRQLAREPVCCVPSTVVPVESVQLNLEPLLAEPSSRNM